MDGSSPRCPRDKAEVIAEYNEGRGLAVGHTFPNMHEAQLAAVEEAERRRMVFRALRKSSTEAVIICPVVGCEANIRVAFRK